MCVQQRRSPRRHDGRLNRRRTAVDGGREPQPVARLRLFGSAAIIFSTLFTFSLLPALLALLKPHIRWKGDSTVASADARDVGAALADRRRSPRRVAVCALLIAACAAFATTRLRVDDSWIRTCQLIATSCKATGSSTKRWGTTAPRTDGGR